MKDSGEIKVSVVVVTYNQAATIGRALDSILCQKTGFPFEIVIGDDASTDGTADICRDYARRYPDIVRLTVNEHNVGILNNYYSSVARARGEYICDLAGDDEWTDDEKLRKQAEALDNNPEVVLVHTNWIGHHTETGNEFPAHECVGSPVVNEKMELVQQILSHPKTPVIHLCTAMYRKSTFDAVRMEDPRLFSDGDLFVEDLQLSAMMAARGKIMYLPDITLRYNISARSISETRDHGKLFDMYMGSLTITRYLAERLCPDTDFGNVYDRLAEFILAQCFYALDRDRKDIFVSKMKEMGIRPTRKVRMMLNLMSDRRLWRLSRQVRMFLKS